MYPSKDIVDNVMNSADHATLIAAVKAAGLGDTLKGAGPSPLYELCSNESELQECQDRMVVAVAFTSEHPFLPDAITDLKGLCVARFAEVTEMYGIACLYAGIEGWRHLSYSERTDIESV
jgi:hypothetical protein